MIDSTGESFIQASKAGKTRTYCYRLVTERCSVALLVYHLLAVGSAASDKNCTFSTFQN